jgi:hypothetical protein
MFDRSSGALERTHDSGGRTMFRCQRLDGGAKARHSPAWIDLMGRSRTRLDWSARDYRDAARIGRNPTIDALECFDRRGFTRRSGDLRRVVGDDSTLKHT